MWPFRGTNFANFLFASLLRSNLHTMEKTLPLRVGPFPVGALHKPNSCLSLKNVAERHANPFTINKPCIKQGNSDRTWSNTQILNQFKAGAPVAHGVTCWPTDIAVISSSELKAKFSQR